MYLRLFCLFVALLFSVPAAAQGAFPDKPIRMVVGYTPGGVTDIAARTISARMSEGLGQSVVVENRGGAAGAVGADFVRRSTPDGYTLLLSPNGPMTVMPAVSSKIPYSPASDFVAVSMVGSFPLILVVNSSRPITSIKDLIEYGKKRPDDANYAGSGTMIQLASELFNLRSGSKFVHIPYKGSGDSINALLANHVTMAMMDAAPATGPLKAGKLRGLAVTSASRLSAWPDIPTMAEAGLSDMVITPWVGLFAPADTPKPVVTRLQKEVSRVVNLPDVRVRLESLGITPAGTTPEQFKSTVASDLERYSAIAKAANIRVD